MFALMLLTFFVYNNLKMVTNITLTQMRPVWARTSVGLQMNNVDSYMVFDFSRVRFTYCVRALTWNVPFAARNLF